MKEQRSRPTRTRLDFAAAAAEDLVEPIGDGEVQLAFDLDVAAVGLQLSLGDGKSLHCAES